MGKEQVKCNFCHADISCCDGCIGHRIKAGIRSFPDAYVSRETYLTDVSRETF